MKVRASLATLAFFASSAASAATIAVIDSGTDYKHKELSRLFWLNPSDIENGKDDDGNGYVDDVWGWNFAENNNKVIDYQYLNSFSEDCYKFFAVQGKVLRGTATEAEKKWLEEKRNDRTFLAELQTFGNFVHGTHVAGISATSRSTERVLSLKIIPTKTPSIGREELEQWREKINKENTPLNDLMMNLFLDMLVKRQVGVIVSAGDYVAAKHIEVANGSFGVSYAAAKQLLKALLGLFGGDTSEENVKKYANMMLEKINEKCRAFVRKSPNTVFVFAAGNDGTDNDALGAAPANLGEPNAISVAASMGFAKLASFSNYGASKVDVAAPGVAITSTIPGDKWLEMSGTSMAAPYVTEVAALVKDANAALSGADVKTIIVGTVDVKSWLQGKVKSGGVVNTARAVHAAKLSKAMTVDQAISQARTAVADQAATKSFDLETDHDIVVTPLPSILPTLPTDL